MSYREPSKTPGTFAGTAEYYARYRWPYPRTVLEHVKSTFALDGTGHLLDIGCGTGLLTFALQPHFKSSRGIDQDPSMVEVAKQRAAQQAIKGIAFEVGVAEEVGISNNFYQLVTFGTSFHWMDRALVTRRAHSALVAGGGIAILTTFSLWQSSAAWQTIINEVIFEYTGYNRGPARGSVPASSSHAEIIAECGFLRPTVARFEEQITYSVETLLGFLYSTSFASKARLGERWVQFEEVLTTKLLAFDPDGRFTEPVIYEVVCGTT